MSKFLGPIHFWLHGKIKLHDQMELAFEQKFAAAHVLDSAYQAFNANFGSPNPDEDLENNINTANIHGWLQERITQSETRFASKLTYLSKQYGDAPIQMAVEVYSAFGTKCAADAIEAGSFNGQPEIAYKLSNNYVLEGMPCDQAGAVLAQTDNHLEWQSTRCLHKKYWESVGGDSAMHYTLRDAFNTAFFNKLDGYSYSRAEQEGVMNYQISKTGGLR